MTVPPGLAAHCWQGKTEREQIWELLTQSGVTAPRRLQIWLSEGTEGRRALQGEFRRHWPECDVQVRNCYKPLISTLLPLLPLWEQRAPKQLHLRYPVLEHSHPERFLLEAYPLAGWARRLGATFVSAADSSGAASYTLTVDGEQYYIPVPLRQTRAVTGEVVQRMTGRILIDDGQRHDFPTAPEQLFTYLLDWLAQQAWSAQPPYLQTLTIKAHFPFEREVLNYGHEALDLGEALSEEIYFGIQEFFQARAGVEAGSRTLQMGWIVPLITPRPGEVGLEISSDWAGPPLESPAPAARLPDLRTLDRPLTPAEALGWQAALADAHTHTYRSVLGRPVEVFGEAQPASGGLLVTAGQHANEATGLVAALRSVQDTRSTQSVRTIPLENPDGYALFHWLRQVQHPEHMHHAARYTALGDDLEYRSQLPAYEKAGRADTYAQMKPALHVNLHGYPSHEWNRPLSGYVPRGFEAWTLPKGFCLIFRFQPGRGTVAQELAEFVARRLSQVPGLMPLNTEQCAAYEAHTSARPYQLMEGTPCLFIEAPDLECPLVLITEFPDETVSGADFLLGQQAQYTVIQAALAWLKLNVS